MRNYRQSETEWMNGIGLATGEYTVMNSNFETAMKTNE